MNNQARRFPGATRFNIIRVNENTARLAEHLAAKYGVTVAYLVEILVHAFKERSQLPGPPPPERPAARVIDLATAARERINRRRREEPV